VVQHHEPHGLKDKLGGAMKDMAKVAVGAAGTAAKAAAHVAIESLKNVGANPFESEASPAESVTPHVQSSAALLRSAPPSFNELVPMP
jgi:hypothetical protein